MKGISLQDFSLQFIIKITVAEFSEFEKRQEAKYAKRIYD